MNNKDKLKIKVAYGIFAGFAVISAICMILFLAEAGSFVAKRDIPYSIITIILALVLISACTIIRMKANTTGKLDFVKTFIVVILVISVGLIPLRVVFAGEAAVVYLSTIFPAGNLFADIQGFAGSFGNNYSALKAMWIFNFLRELSAFAVMIIELKSTSKK